MKAIILAAGIGSRLYPLALNTPKCLFEIGGRSIVERQIETIRSIGIKDILVVVGYKKELIINTLGSKVRYKEYPDFAKTNNLHTLWSIKDELNDDFMCFFSDLIFESELIKRAKDSTEDICMVVNLKKVVEGTMRIKLVEGKIAGVGKHISLRDGSGIFLGIAKFSKSGASLLCNQMGKMVSGHFDDYYTIALDRLAKEGLDIGYVDASDKMWLEIDTKEDLDNAIAIENRRQEGHGFLEGEER